MLRDAAGARPAVVVVDLDRGERRVVARGPIRSPTWSPDGSRLAFTSHDGLYAALGDGSGLRRIVATKRLTHFAWSPDGTRLAFVHRVGSQERLEVIASDGRSRRIVSEGSSIRFEWAPTGERIAYSPTTRDGRDPLRIVTADGSATVELLDGDASYYSWSPDGTRIAFARSSGLDDALYIAAPNGSGRRLVAGDISYGLSWSPDGRQLAFVRSEGDDEVVYASSADGTVVRRLGACAEVFCFGLVWAPDSGRLALDGGAGITIVALDGSVISRIGGARSPAWSPDGRSLAYEAGELGIADADGAGRRVLTSTQPDPRSVGVDVRSLSTGAYLGRFPIDGQPLAVALAPLRVAVLVQRAAGKRIELHHLNGSLERAVAVPRATSSELSMAGRWVVFRTGRAIHLLDVRTGRRRVLALARETPVGLSIEGRRVAWAEQTRPSRVRAILLPRA